MSIPFLMWYDDSPRRSIDQKIADGLSRFADRFHGAQANLVLVNPTQIPDAVPSGLSIVVKTEVARNTFWIGRQE